MARNPAGPPSADDLTEAEEQFLAAERDDPGSPYYLGDDPVDTDRVPSRRRFMLGAMAALGAAAAAPGIAYAKTLGAPERPVPPDATKVQGTGVRDDDGGYGSRSQFETEARDKYATKTSQSSWSFTPLQNSMGIITPSGLHYERHHGGTATIDPSKHELFVHGMVNKAKKFNMAALKQYPAVSRLMFLECSGNGLTEWAKPTLKTVQGTHGLTSTSEWVGVPLSTVLNEVGVKPGAKWLLCEGGDAAVMTRSIPLEKAMRDCLLAYGQNGEAIRPEQGYPLRLFVPGFEGNMSIKWLRRIEVADAPFMTREETSKYTDLLPDGTALQFSFLMEAKSVITYPSGEMLLRKPGTYQISGLAWSGRGKITKVEVSADGGRTWREATLHGPVLPVCHTRFTVPWDWDGKEAVLQSRCTDETGYVQPTIGQLVKERGLTSTYHLNSIQSWKVGAGGEVTNVRLD
jgi:sulfane dehydrogenase subunit SoxC